METKIEKQKFQIGDAVEIGTVGEIESIAVDCFSKQLEYKVRFGKNGVAWVTADSLRSVPSDESESNHVAPDGSC